MDKTLKYTTIAMSIVIVVTMLSFLCGVKDGVEFSKEHLSELMIEQCHLPQSGGTCKMYCSVGDTDLYELNVEYKKVEVEQNDY